MNRRNFLISSGALLSQSLIPTSVLANEVNATLYYGFGKNDIGSELGRLSAQLLNEVAPKYAYDLVNYSNEGPLLASNVVKGAVADGSVLLQATSTVMSLYRCLYNNLPYDPIKDFVPVGFLGESTYMLVVGSAVSRKVKTVDDYINWVFDNPEYRNVGSILYGSESHLAGLTLAFEKDIALSIQAYGGASIMVEDLLDGNLAAGILVTGDANEAIAAGRLRVLGVCSSERHPPWPCVPTLAEQGVDNMDFRGWYAWFAPSNISVSTLIELSKAFERMHDQKVFKTLQASLALNPLDLSPADIQFRIQEETKNCERLYKKYEISRVTL